MSLRTEQKVANNHGRASITDIDHSLKNPSERKEKKRGREKKSDA
jgi:hypothetical protein